MTAVIREDKIDDTIAALNQYMVAAQPIDMDAPGFAPDELAMIRQHRIGRAKLALENIGIQIAQPFGMPAASESVIMLEVVASVSPVAAAATEMAVLRMNSRRRT